MYFAHFLKVPQGADPLDYCRRAIEENMDENSPEFPQFSRAEIDDIIAVALKAWPELESDAGENEDGSYTAVLTPKNSTPNFIFDIFGNEVMVCFPADGMDDKSWSKFAAIAQAFEFRNGLVLYEDKLELIIDPSRDMDVLRRSYEESKKISR